MPTTLEGNLIASGMKLAIVSARWNHFINDRLLEGALDAIVRHGGDDDDVTIVKVPGSFEIPLAANKLVDTGDYDAVICLGVLIRGATPHFDFIASECTKGVGSAAMRSGVPVSFGVITTDTIEQAIERAGTKVGNKGEEAALAAIEMVNLYKAMQS